MRQRLSWDKNKVAEISKKADPYTMNQDHTNNPVEKYKNWDTETGGEGVDMRQPARSEGRTETGHPAPTSGPAAAPVATPAVPAPMEPAQAVMAARKLEDKALKCITIAQRMLPGAEDTMIEAQATDLMYLPEKMVLATLQRQAELAETLAGDTCEKGTKEEDDDKPAVEAKKEDKPATEPVADKPVTEPEVKETTAAKAPEAAPAAPVVEPEAKKPAEEEIEMEKTASDADLLDMIFANEEPKNGAKKLSGIVKQASEGIDLNNLWDSPPDVSKAFK